MTDTAIATQDATCTLKNILPSTRRVDMGGETLKLRDGDTITLQYDFKNRNYRLIGVQCQK